MGVHFKPLIVSSLFTSNQQNTYPPLKDGEAVVKSTKGRLKQKYLIINILFNLTRNVLSMSTRINYDPMRTQDKATRAGKCGYRLLFERRNNALRPVGRKKD